MCSKGRGIYHETSFFDESKRYVTGQILLDIVKIETVIRENENSVLLRQDFFVLCESPKRAIFDGLSLRSL